MVPSSARNWIAVNAVQQSSLNKKMKTKNMTTLQLRKSIGRSPWRRGLLLIPFLLICFALSPHARAVCQEGCDPSNANTFLGDAALMLNTTGYSNTALG